MGPTGSVTVSGGNPSRVFQVDSGVTANLGIDDLRRQSVLRGWNRQPGDVDSDRDDDQWQLGQWERWRSLQFRWHDHADELHDCRQHERGQRRRLVRGHGARPSRSPTAPSAATPPSAGGGVKNYQATVTISGSTVTGNTATSDAGGILDNGMMTIDQSTIANNKATSTSGGGGIRVNHQAANAMATVLTVTNSTITGNTSSGRAVGSKALPQAP